MRLSSTLPLTLPLLAAAARKPSNAILLSDVSTLTLHGGRKTTARRVAPIPQLRCVSPRALCDIHPISVMRCTNEGASYAAEDVEWACTAALPETLQLASTDVICEGFMSADDPYVLRGSCGVEYRVELTAAGRAAYPELRRSTPLRTLANVLFIALFVAVFGMSIWSSCTNAAGFGAPRRRRWGGGGGGGWGWGPGNGGGPSFGGGPGWSGKEGEAGWSPGFWTGLAAGAASGYMARGNREREDAYYARRAGQFGHGNARAMGGETRGSTGYGSTRRR
ncbi:hypothetical protein BROUX41_006209 [Berkeleyomyces rouxiae]|uniref:uncharacterized protein n=1 Tax=Berkeleyomyces rouxiae TaxID=2035830 RepID=UPI003B80410B